MTMCLLIKQSFSFAHLRSCQPCQPSPIVKFLLEPKRLNCSARLPLRPFSTSRQARPNLYQSNTRSPHLAKATRCQSRRSYPKTHFQDPKPARWQPPQPGTGTLVIGSIIGACVGVFFYNGRLQLEATRDNTRAARQKAKASLEHFVMSARSLDRDKYYTLITSAFMHRDFLHLSLCMLGLWSFGRAMIVFTGVPSFVVLYFGSAVAGGIAQVKFWEHSRAPNVVKYGVGSSGAISGLFAAMTCLTPTSRVWVLFFPMPIYVGFALNLVISIGGMQGRWLQGWGHADHLGGMAFGVVWWLLAMRRGAPLGRLFSLTKN